MDQLRLTLLDVLMYNLLALNFDMREKVDVNYSDLRDLKDHATVSFDPGVGTGKTTWLYHTAAEDDVLICRVPLDLPCDGAVLRPDEIYNAPLGTLASPTTVNIDAASTYSPQELDVIYSRYACDGVTFVLVG